MLYRDQLRDRSYPDSYRENGVHPDFPYFHGVSINACIASSRPVPLPTRADHGTIARSEAIPAELVYHCRSQLLWSTHSTPIVPAYHAGITGRLAEISVL
jgi:hypothetical protein